MSPITTHILDTARGRPARGVPVTLEMQDGESSWRELGRGETDGDGRLRTLLAADHQLVEGIYRLTFDTSAYFDAHNSRGFYPHVVVVFAVRDAAEHYHVPLLLNPYGYTTYRGS